MVIKHNKEPGAEDLKGNAVGDRKSKEERKDLRETFLGSLYFYVKPR